MKLPTCLDQGEAEDRALLLTEQVRHLRMVGKALRIIPRNPLPKGFMPKSGKPPGFSFLYPQRTPP